ncbi:MAG: PfkB family carbohydrate kinase, partial [Pseudomonadota bacterium]|nr:PfkB family carbohydrate kinase [Pseudomonadota bacterium]
AAHRAGRQVALTLSDSFCVERFLDPFRELVAATVDVLLGNADELCLLYETDDVDSALAAAGQHCDLVAVTRGAAGASIAADGRRVDVAAERATVVDTTGAGDLFAAGFLAARARGRPIRQCLEAGAAAAAEVISHYGARPEADLKELVRL